MPESSNRPLSLATLPEDVLLIILSFCDVEDIVSLAKQCFSLWRAASSRHLWRGKLVSLDVSHAPDFPRLAHAPDLATRKIKELVVNADRSFRSWHTPDGPKARSERIQTLIPSPLSRVHDSACLNSVRVTPGGNYLVVYWTCGAFQCFHADRLTHIFTYTPFTIRDHALRSCRYPRSSFKYTVELSEDKNSILLLVVGRLWDELTCRLSIYKYDLESNEGVVVFDKILWLDPSWESPGVLCGKYAVEAFSGTGLFVVNWETGDAFIIRLYGWYKQPFSVISDHVIICTPLAARNPTYHDLSIVSLDYAWRIVRNPAFEELQQAVLEVEWDDLRAGMYMLPIFSTLRQGNPERFGTITGISAYAMNWNTSRSYEDTRPTTDVCVRIYMIEVKDEENQERRYGNHVAVSEIMLSFDDDIGQVEWRRRHPVSCNDTQCSQWVRISSHRSRDMGHSILAYSACLSDRPVTFTKSGRFVLWYTPTCDCGGEYCGQEATLCCAHCILNYRDTEERGIDQPNRNHDMGHHASSEVIDDAESASTNDGKVGLLILPDRENLYAQTARGIWLEPGTSTLYLVPERGKLELRVSRFH